MSRRYALARGLAALETVPEIRDRLLAAADRFERLRLEAEVGPYGTTDVGVQEQEVFENLYAQATQAVDAAIDQPTVSGSELVALTEMVRRVEGAVEAFSRRLDAGGDPGPVRASVGGGKMLLVGAVLLGGVLFWSSRS